MATSDQILNALERIASRDESQITTAINDLMAEQARQTDVLFRINDNLFNITDNIRLIHERLEDIHKDLNETVTAGLIEQLQNNGIEIHNIFKALLAIGKVMPKSALRKLQDFHVEVTTID